MNFSLIIIQCIHVVVHLSAIWFVAWMYIGLDYDAFGSDPVQGLTHYSGLKALQFLLLSLCITPLAKFLRKPALIRLRRPLGVWCFVFASLHFAIWISLDLQFMWGFIGEEIVKRKYLLVGFTAWLILLALAATSFKAIQRKMKLAWKKLHQWVYLAALLAPVHFFMSVKSAWYEPAVYLLCALFLLSLRQRILLKYLRR